VNRHPDAEIADDAIRDGLKHVTATGGKMQVDAFFGETEGEPLADPLRSACDQRGASL
jgi:hypothetical protein